MPAVTNHSNDARKGGQSSQFHTTRPGEFDQFVLDGDLGLGGTLELALLDGFVPVPGFFFDIIFATNVTGQFDVIVGARINSRLRWVVHYESDRVRIVAVERIAGDEPGADFDWDGLTNEEEAILGRDPYDAGDADQNSDGDALSDLIELLIATSATDASDVADLFLGSGVDGEGGRELEVFVPHVPEGWSVSLEESETLEDWTPVQGSQIRFLESHPSGVVLGVAVPEGSSLSFVRQVFSRQ